MTIFSWVIPLAGSIMLKLAYEKNLEARSGEQNPEEIHDAAPVSNPAKPLPPASEKNFCLAGVIEKVFICFDYILDVAFVIITRL